nr:glycosyltransferase family 4 protein [Pedococcus badiiscoriae]
MVGNDIAHDTRVLKMGLTLADAGVDVTLLGYASSEIREERMLGDVRIIRVPVGWRLRDAAARRRAARRRPRLSVAVEPNARRVLDLQAAVRRREAESVGGLANTIRGNRLRASRYAARIRGGADRRLRKWQGEVWHAVDGVTHRTPWGASWRRLLPEIDDYELAFGPVLDQLEWDVLHAHDIHLVGVASRAVARRRASGRTAAWVYDAHEYVAGLSIYGARTKRKRAAYLDLEREYIRDADAVVTVTEPLAAKLRSDHHLPAVPAVVMNSPMLGAGDHAVEHTIREQIGLGPEVPLVVYSGGVTAVRGVDTAVEALAQLPDVHLAVVAVPHKQVDAAQALALLAAELGVSDRLHLLDPVGPDEVSAYLATADVGILPIHHYGSHEVAIPNKMFEYLHAGVPLLVSDCEAPKAFVQQHGVGGVHVAQDTDSFVRELRGVLDRLPELKQRIAEDPDLLTPYAWDRQEAVLREVYRAILGAERVHEPTTVTQLEGLRERPSVRNDRASVVGIGPANMAGQAWAWAKAIERYVPGCSTEVVSVDRGSALVFEADELVPASTYAKDASWAQAFESRALEHWTHALLEAGRPMFGLRNGRDFTGDVPVLRSVGIEVGLLLHGSEIRNPRRHASSTPWSPFGDPDEELTARLQSQWDVLHPLVTAFEGPVFVSTPDLLDDVPGSHLLPVVVDIAAWATTAPVLERPVPVVLHAPSRASIKGTAHVTAAMEPLAAAGLIDFRLLEGLAPSEMPAAVADADIVLDQFSLGSYGVMAVQAMAAGRVVVGHVTDAVRAACPGDLPLVEATPDTLAAVVRGLLDDRAAGVAAAAAGPGYAADVHGGERSAAVLAEVLGLRGE